MNKEKIKIDNEADFTKYKKDLSTANKLLKEVQLDIIRLNFVILTAIHRNNYNTYNN